MSDKDQTERCPEFNGNERVAPPFTPESGGPYPDDIRGDDEFIRELEAMDDAPDRPSLTPDLSGAKAVIFGRLRAAGVVSVLVEFEGYGDSGCIERVTAVGVGGGEQELADDLKELIEEYVYERLPGGWEIDDGSFGEVKFDVQAGTVAFDFHQRFCEVTDEQWEE